jgi:hypothetical protein
MAEEHDDTQERGSEEIRREIEQTRASMGETVDELGHRLNPGNLADEVWDRVRTRTVSQLSETFREHTIPIALMGLGLGWLAVERATRRSDGHAAERPGPGTWEPAEGRRGPYRSDAIDRGDPDWPHASAGAKVKHKVEELQTQVSGKTHEMRERASDLGHRMADRTRARSQSARDGFRSFMDESPLVVGAIAFGVGLAGGLSVPSSPVEDRLMGPASGTVKDEAARLARQTKDSAKRVAREAAEAAKSEAEQVRQEEEGTIRDVVDELKGAAKRVVSSATETAREAAYEENLTRDALAEEARQVATRARDASRSGRATRRSRSRVPEGG